MSNYTEFSGTLRVRRDPEARPFIDSLLEIFSDSGVDVEVGESVSCTTMEFSGADTIGVSDVEEAFAALGPFVVSYAEITATDCNGTHYIWVGDPTDLEALHMVLSRTVEPLFGMPLMVLEHAALRIAEFIEHARDIKRI